MSEGVAGGTLPGLTAAHLHMSKRGGKVEAHMRDGREVIGKLGRIGHHAFGVTLADGSRTSVKMRDVDYVVTELSL